MSLCPIEKQWLREKLMTLPKFDLEYIYRVFLRDVPVVINQGGIHFSETDLGPRTLREIYDYVKSRGT